MTVHFLPAVPGEGGICDPAALSAAITAATTAGRRIGSVVVTLPDNPTGRLARPATVRALCQVAAAYGLVIISDEIYRDLVHDPAALALSPAQVAPAAAVAAVCAHAGLIVPPPQAGFYVYPDFEPWRDHLRDCHQVTTSAGLARLLLDRYGAAALPGSAFGEPQDALRLRLATALLYGDSEEQQEAALAAPDPTALPPTAAALTRLSEILDDLADPVPGAASPGRRAERPDPTVPHA